MTKVTIDHEERYTVIKHKDLTVDDMAELDHLIRSRHIPTRACLVIESDWPEYEPAWRMIEERVTGAAPRQPEGDGLEVVAHLEGDEAVVRPHRVYADARRKYDYARRANGAEPLVRLSDSQRSIAELQEECSFLKDCQENAILHMTGLVAERDTLRQQLAERDAQIASMRAEVTPFIETHWMPVARQRDKLAHLCKCALGYDISSALRTQINAALAEVGG